jgi:tripartite-type tricarboxylate transporter receptor subunit TctC
MKGLVVDQWLGVFVPAGTPAPVVARLNAEIGKALADPAIKGSLEKSAQEPIGGTPAAFAKLVNEDFGKYGRLVKELGLKVQ